MNAPREIRVPAGHRRRTSRNLAAFAFAEDCGDHPFSLFKRAFKWLPAVVIPMAALLCTRELPNWLYMWAIAVALFFAAKWLTFAPLLTAPGRLSATRSLAYFFLWPGLNARAFLAAGAPQQIGPREALKAVTNVVGGAVLVFAALQLDLSIHPLVAGWLAMIGIVLLLHFGFFALLSIFWRSRGVDAPPLMQSPIASNSLAKLWSGRWNTAFTQLMHAEVLAPIAKRFGILGGLLGVFLVSGLLHEAVISVPACGGYGLPTAYFALQCCGIFVERSEVGKTLGLSHGAKGWLFCFAFAAAPVFILFPPSFIHNVIVPMIQFVAQKGAV
jgi:alginate O-acetyltransferase complex protein AlgI